MAESKPRKARIPSTRRKYQMYASMGGGCLSQIDILRKPIGKCCFIAKREFEGVIDIHVRMRGTPKPRQPLAHARACRKAPANTPTKPRIQLK